MIQKETSTSVEVDLKALEVRVEELINACQFLKDENKNLRAKQENLVSEKAELVEKTEMARTRIESMITRLKSLET